MKAALTTARGVRRKFDRLVKEYARYWMQFHLAGSAPFAEEQAQDRIDARAGMLRTLKELHALVTV